MEEKKINSPKISPKKRKNNNKEVIEISLGRPNPAYNLVSIKARYRFHQIKQNFSKLDYNAYIRRCKNMYSISSKMSSELDVSDIYHEEKKNINGILDIFHRIDDKISSKRIRLTKFKKDSGKIKMLKEKSLSAINLYKVKPNLSKFRITSNDFSNLSNNINLQSRKLNANKNNNSHIKNKKMNSTYCSNFKGDFSNILINSKMNDTNFNKTFSPSFNNKNIILNKKKENIENKNTNIYNPKKISEEYGLYNFKTKQSPLSGKSTGLTITNFGAIIYNNSIFRNKNISNFLYNNQSLPLIYSSKY